MATYLSDILELTAEAMNLPLSPLSDYSEDGVNEIADNAIFPALIYNTRQTGTLSIERSGKAYLEYQVSLIFANVVDSEQATKADNLQVMDDMMELGSQFLQRMLWQDAYKRHPANSEALRPTFTTFELKYDVDLVGVELNLVLKIDPAQDINSCDV